VNGKMGAGITQFGWPKITMTLFLRKTSFFASVGVLNSKIESVKLI
jgi:hypothetical protein